MVSPMVNGNGNRMSAGPVPSIPSWTAGVDLHGASIPTAAIPTLSGLGRFPVPMQQSKWVLKNCTKMVTGVPV